MKDLKMYVVVQNQLTFKLKATHITTQIRKVRASSEQEAKEIFLSKVEANSLVDSALDPLVFEDNKIDAYY